MKTYQDTLDFLYQQLPMFSRVGAVAFKKDLDNTRTLCKHFNHPQNKFKSIHIGGTNGKGSVSNYLASMFVEFGYKVGIYTSPHLVDFRERIKIGNEMISKEFVVDFVEKAKPVIEVIKPSFFELTVVMAFEYFAQNKIDIAIVEVGLGGRLDSTNIIQPELSVITNVSFDHTNMLGNTIEEIAKEKAGIIKNNTPIIIGEKNSTYSHIMELKASEVSSSLIYAEDRVVLRNQDKDYAKFGIQENFSIDIQNSYLIPPYQIKNIKTSIAAFHTYLQKINIVDELRTKKLLIDGIKNRTKNTDFLGRWTLVQYRQRTLILESAHNEAGIEELNQTIATLNLQNLKIMYASVNDKDISKIIKILPKKATYYLTQANIPRALDVSELKSIFEYNTYSIHFYNSDSKVVLDKFIDTTHENDTLIITGSIFLVGEILGIVKNEI